MFSAHFSDKLNRFCRGFFSGLAFVWICFFLVSIASSALAQGGVIEFESGGGWFGNNGGPLDPEQQDMEAGQGLIMWQLCDTNEYTAHAFVTEGQGKDARTQVYQSNAFDFGSGYALVQWRPTQFAGEVMVFGPAVLSVAELGDPVPGSISADLVECGGSVSSVGACPSPLPQSLQVKVLSFDIDGSIYRASGNLAQQSACGS